LGAVLSEISSENNERSVTEHPLKHRAKPLLHNSGQDDDEGTDHHPVCPDQCHVTLKNLQQKQKLFSR
jgi:hypothetical protein